MIFLEFLRTSRCFRIPQKQLPVVFCKKAVLKIFPVFIGKHLCWSFFLTRLHAFKPAVLLKRDSIQHWCFSVNIAKFFRTPILNNICQRLLLIPLVGTFENVCYILSYSAEFSFILPNSSWMFWAYENKWWASAVSKNQTQILLLLMVVFRTQSNIYEEVNLRKYSMTLSLSNFIKKLHHRCSTGF